MMTPSIVTSAVDERFIIKFLVKEYIKAAEFHRRLFAQLGDTCLSCGVFKWNSKFKNGQNW